ncbi:MAG: MotA/TolQ/ExbB proton channel family protein [Myxococcota bacterium]
MNINERFLQFALTGSEWVLWVLVALSGVALTVAVERFLRFRRAAAGQHELRGKAESAWGRIVGGGSTPDEELEYLASQARGSSGPAATMLAAVGAARREGVEAVQRIVAAARMQERRALERYLDVLGTIGSNAPFIGLFGTVLEILRVFNFIGNDGMGNASQSQAIMSGISEALVATGIGLLVAIPAVVGFNAFTRWLDSICTEADEIVEIALGVATSEGANDGRVV